MKPFKMFISHRHEDAAIADRLADRLSMYGGEKLAVFRSESPAKVGKAWHTRIQEILREAELFLLLLTAPSELSSEWDWSLFEVGLFSSATATDSKKKIIALLPPNLNVPPVIQDIQHVHAVQDEVAYFLKELFLETELTGREGPINPHFAKDRDSILQLADEICLLLSPVSLSAGARMHANSLILKLQERLREPVIPASVEIEADAISLKMFGLLARDQFTWGDIISSLHGETAWVSELSEAIYSISNGRYAKPIKSTFNGGRPLDF